MLCNFYIIRFFFLSVYSLSPCLLLMHQEGAGEGQRRGGGGAHTVESPHKLYLVFYEFQISYVS